MTHPLRAASSFSILRSDRKPLLLRLLAAFLTLAAIAAPAEAARMRHRPHTILRSVRAAPVDISSELIIDARTGEVLHAKDASTPRYPASLTKMMTLYLTFDALKQGKMRLTQQLPVTAHAASMPATNLALRPGSYLPVETAIKALVVRSANDAAVVLAEALGGTEAQFAELMTRKARQLGMNATVFKNASGLPNREQRTTARDLAVLALALNKHFPSHYSYFKTTEFAYNGQTYKTHNRVLLKYPGCDGLKTGFINASGFNLVSAVHRNDRYIVGVVMGSSTWASRDKRMMDLFDQALGLRGAPMGAIANSSRVGVSKTQTASLEREITETKATPKAVTTAAAEPAEIVITPAVQLAATTAPLTTQKGDPVATQPSEETVAQGAQSDAPDARVVAKAALPARSAAPNVAPNSAKVINASVAQAQTLDAQLSRSRRGVQVASLQSNPAFSAALGSAGWGIQVGAYARRDEAQAAARKVQGKLPGELSHAQPLAVSDATGAIQRARLAGLSEQEARTACRKLVQEREACFVFQAN